MRQCIAATGGRGGAGIVRPVHGLAPRSAAACFIRFIRRASTLYMKASYMYEGFDTLYEKTYAGLQPGQTQGCSLEHAGLRSAPHARRHGRSGRVR